MMKEISTKTALTFVATACLAVSADLSAADPQVLLYTTESIPSGTDDETNIYELNVSTGAVTLLGTVPAFVSPGDPNGNAWDPVNNRLYFVRMSTKQLFFWDFSSPTATLAGTTTGTVAGAGFYSGAYYYVANGQDDLRRVTFNGDGTIASDQLLKANFDGGVGSAYYFGDVAIKEGILYGGPKVQPNSREHFFSLQVTWPYTYTLIDSAWHGSTQMAFGCDGILYAHRYGVWYEVDLATGDLIFMGVPPGGVQIPDLASAPCGPGCITDLIADGGPNGSYTDVGSVIVTDNGDGTWDVTYQTTGTWELVELQLDVACSLDQIPQTGAGNPKIGKFCYDAEDLDPGTQSYTFEAVSPAECDNGECDCVLFAAHAVVVDTGDCWLEDLDGDGIPETEVCREETGWGEGPGFPGNNWAMYFDCGDCE